MSESVTGDTVIRTADGSIFLLRREVLEACRVREPENISQMEKILGDHEVGGYALATGGIIQTVTFPTAPIATTPSFNPNDLKINTTSTIMCCW